MCNRKKLLTLQPLLLFVLLIHSGGFGQIRWDGDAGDGQWMTPANWTGDVLPDVTDDVILDNTFIGNNYSVKLPAGNISVHVKSVSILPGAGNTIELMLPTTNTAPGAFVASGSMYGLVIGNGGIFRNASGALNGIPAEISDSIRINNGGRYIQNSRRSHAANVTVLSKAPGTEEGIFEFDIPSASNTISLSGRTYGKLVLSSRAMNGAATYTATGTNPVTVQSDLEIEPGVTLSLNLSDTLFIRRDMIQYGGVINLGNSTRTLITAVKRHLLQSTGGTICETGTAFPEIVFSGSSNQQIDCKGIITGAVSIKINNAAGITLMSPLSLPYMLNLARGKITTSSVNVLTLLPGCNIRADSLSESSFIDGPLHIQNASDAVHFLCPIGKGNSMGWLGLNNVTGYYTVEYFKSNPQQISALYGPDIHHISNIEYWAIQAEAAPIPTAAIELSFKGPNNGAGTDLTAFRVARLSNGAWVNAGNTAVTGMPGSQGSVVSNSLSDWSAAPEYFALAGTTAAGGPLSLRNDTVRSTNVRNINSTTPLQLLSISSFSATPVLTCRSAEKRPVQFYIVAITGNVVKTIAANVERGINKLPVRITSLPAGEYSIQAFTNKGPSNTLLFVSGIK